MGTKVTRNDYPPDHCTGMVMGHGENHALPDHTIIMWECPLPGERKISIIPNNEITEVV